MAFLKPDNSKLLTFVANALCQTINVSSECTVSGWWWGGGLNWKRQWWLYVRKDRGETRRRDGNFLNYKKWNVSRGDRWCSCRMTTHMRKEIKKYKNFTSLNSTIIVFTLTFTCTVRTLQQIIVFIEQTAIWLYIHAWNFENRIFKWSNWSFQFGQHLTTCSNPDSVYLVASADQVSPRVWKGVIQITLIINTL